MSKTTLRTELAILEKHFPRHEGSFQIALANPEELVCRFVDSSGHKYTIQCSISVSSVVCVSECARTCNSRPMCVLQ